MSFDTREICAANDLAKIAAHYGPLVRSGREYVGCCMIHGGDNPTAFTVYEKDGKQLWHCFTHGCHEQSGSDVIGYIQGVERLDFQAACEFLGAVNGKSRDWSPQISNPPRPKMPERVTCKPPADAGVPNMTMRQLGEPSAVWTYRDTDGGTLGYVARYETPEGKEIRCWTFGGDPLPDWKCAHFSKPRPLFHLEALASRLSAPVLITEGEKAADAAGLLLPAYVAVTWPGGAGAWKHADWTPLRGRRVLLWPDNDEPGRKAMADLAAMLSDPQGLACAVKMIDPSDLAPGDDAADLLAAGFTPAQTLDWARANAREYTYKVVELSTGSTESDAPEGAEPASASPSPASTLPVASDLPKPLKSDSEAATSPVEAIPGDFRSLACDEPTDAAPPEPPPEPGSTATRPPKKPRKGRGGLSVVGNTALAPDPDGEVLPMELSEVGVAKEFCDKYHADFRVVHEWGGKHGACWLAWNGARWMREPNRKTAYQRMSVLCTGLKYRDGARGMTEAGKTKFERVAFIKSCLDQAQFDVRLIAAPDVWDADPLMLGTPAGTVDLREGKLIEPDPDHLITRSTAVAPQQGPHPLFDDVIRRAAGGDRDMTAYLWRALGYGAITGCVNEEVFWYLWGKPQCGKTTLIEAIADIAGDVDAGGYACQVEIDIFTESKQDSRNADRLAHLAGARFAYASEMEEGKNFKAALLKMAVGGDRMGGKFLYQERFTFLPTHKIWIFGNQIMHLRTADQGIRRRMHLIEYDERFVVTDEERDNNFKAKLKSEYPAILASLIQGALDWQQAGGLGRPEQISRKVDDYMEAEDTLAEFVDSCLTLDVGGHCSSSAAYSAYKAWCDKHGEFCPSGKRFTQQMRARGFALAHTRAGNQFEGFTITQTDPRPSDYYDR